VSEIEIDLIVVASFISLTKSEENMIFQLSDGHIVSSIGTENRAVAIESKNRRSDGTLPRFDSSNEYYQ
jgi:hypothetical protein